VKAELQAAINELYRAFAVYQRPVSFEGCGCCWGGPGSVPIPSNGDVRGLVRVPAPGAGRPLADLSPDEIRDVACEVPLTAGTLEVFKHYLPRIFEIAAQDGFEWPDLEIIVGRLADDEVIGCKPWVEWSEDEQVAVRAFLRALWRERLAVDDADAAEGPIDAAFCAIASIESTIDWYLEEWLKFSTTAASINFERFIQSNLQTLMKSELDNPYWNRDRPPADANVARLLLWLRSDETRASVALAADNARTPAERRALEECYSRWLPALTPS
jgi:hypothetical protein